MKFGEESKKKGEKENTHQKKLQFQMQETIWTHRNFIATSMNTKTTVKMTNFPFFYNPWPECTVCMGNHSRCVFVMFRWDWWLLSLLLILGCCQNQVFCVMQQEWGCPMSLLLHGAQDWSWPDGCCPMGAKSSWHFWASANTREKLPVVLGPAQARECRDVAEMGHGWAKRESCALVGVGVHGGHWEHCRGE